MNTDVDSHARGKNGARLQPKNKERAKPPHYRKPTPPSSLAVLLQCLINSFFPATRPIVSCRIQRGTASS